jgi:hypothetical protein
LQKGTYGLIGRVGFYIVVVGGLTQILEAVFFISAGSALEWVGEVGFMTVIVGFWVFGAATLRAGILPWWCGVGLIVAIVLPLVLDPGGGSSQGLFWVALGYVLWSRRNEPAEQPSRVS